MFQGFVVKLGTTLPIWSPTTSVPVALPVPGALSPVRADLLPPCKRIRYSDFKTDFEVSLEEGYVSYVPREIADIDACIAFADDIAARGTDFRVEDGTAAEEEAESSARGTIKVGVDRVTHLVVSEDIVEPVREDFLELVSADGSLEVMQRGLDMVMHELYDHMAEIPIHRVKVIESVHRDQGHTIVATSQQSAAMSERISMLERDNMRLRGMLGVERQRVDHLRHSMSCRTMLTATRSRMTQDAMSELIAKRVEEDLQAYDAAKNPRTETEIENEQQDDNVEVNDNNGNGNGNGNKNPNVNNKGVVPVTRECTYQDFMKFQSLNFKGTKGVVSLTCWFEKMKTVFLISNCPLRYQVKYASCTLLDGALTWWNFHKRTVGVYATYAMMWKALMKLMTEVYYPRNEIQKMEIELWNLTVKGNDLTAYNQGFQELTLLCTKMVSEEEDQACSFMLCDLDFEPLSLSLSSLPSCGLMSLTNMLILLHYLESFKSELLKSLSLNLKLSR
ncbi:reverse transcriptase domain-containing protein [Tanacetum coccineum]|uniref:Reverse transcriptase domain-containing protein n=1 Tax=Tanacetum coccineum TaxID=301880 RepID=A0ABQ5B9V6_9ASTR